MLYNINYDIVASIVFAILLFFFGSRKRRTGIVQYKVYNTLMLLCFAAAISDIISAIAISHPEKYSIPMLYFFNICYFLMQNAIIIIYLIYVYSLINVSVHGDMAHSLHISIPLAVMSLLLFTTPFTKLIFFFDAEKNYQRGSCHFLFYIFLAYFFMLSTVQIFRYRNTIAPKKRIVLYSFFIILIMTIVIQISLPSQLVNIFGISLCAVLAVFTLQNPEEVFDTTTGAMLYSQFIMVINSRFVSNQRFTIITVHINDYAYLCNTLSVIRMDEIMKEVVSYLKSVKHESIAGKINGHTFALMLNNKSGNAEAIIDDIKKRFEEPWTVNEAASRISVSIGCLSCPEDVNTIDEFYDAIDAILNSHHNGSEAIFVKDLTDIKKINEVRKSVQFATATNGFEVYYQPIYSADKKRIVAAEALVRLNDERLGFISPELFIPIAESDGYILEIGKFVFESVCRFISEHELYEKGIEYIEVNLSVVQCMQYRLAEEFIAIMKKYDIPPKYINFEITETAAIHSIEALTRNMQTFSEHGITFALDDYGTGYSNISYVYNLPFNFVKIDKSILWSSVENPKAYITLKNTFAMIKKLDMKIVMEGVETEEQIEKLLELDCDYLQGFYFSKAVPEDEFISYVSDFTLPTICS